MPPQDPDIDPDKGDTQQGDDDLGQVILHHRADLRRRHRDEDDGGHGGCALPAQPGNGCEQISHVLATPNRRVWACVFMVAVYRLVQIMTAGIASADPAVM